MADRDRIICHICERQIPVNEEGMARGGFYLRSRYVCPECEKVIINLEPHNREYDWLVRQIKKALAG
ncbi:MAG TPA: sigma factor G inhibitor Gin [Bacillota bacterium]|nr:sigma factor G inhibitor Gin [Bacillota bacterium]